jgi:PLP dependent protein
VSKPIAERVAAVKGRIERAAREAGRDPGDVTLVAVSKTWPANVCEEAIESGITTLGENRAQEFKEKHALIGDRATWHFVGNLQTNKVRNVVGAAALIHSLDRFGLAEAIDKRARRMGIVQDVLVEVNVSREASKHGVPPEDVESLMHDVARLEGVRVRGLMTMPPMTDDAEGARPYFKELATMRDSLAERWPLISELSMGMTRDFERAIEEGATIVRIGEAIFGPRRTG